MGISDSVRLTGSVADADLPARYSAADLFAYIPLYEGFGLPPVEAPAGGCPVLARNVSSLPEILGAAALQVTPTAVAAISDGIAT